MKRILPVLLTAGLLTTGLIGAASASILPQIHRANTNSATITKHYVEVDDGVWVAVKGKRERRQVRYARLIASWSADKRAAASEFGFPVFRHRDLTAGILTEVWSYPSHNVEVVFDAAGRRLSSRLR